MGDSDHRIGGGESKSSYAVLFALGTVVGTVIRTGMWMLPSSLVDRVTSKLGSK